ncbi:MAG TPA: hypothetical protein VK208_22245 [Pyrinomonadaceae bacterium]|nr:hypothetical protein [Pyrinomonadaceae bacterium]
MPNTLMKLIGARNSTLAADPCCVLDPLATAAGSVTLACAQAY